MSSSDIDKFDLTATSWKIGMKNEKGCLYSTRLKLELLTIPKLALFVLQDQHLTGTTTYYKHRNIECKEICVRALHVDLALEK